MKVFDGMLSKIRNSIVKLLSDFAKVHFEL